MAEGFVSVGVLSLWPPAPSPRRSRALLWGNGRAMLNM